MTTTWPWSPWKRHNEPVSNDTSTLEQQDPARAVLNQAPPLEPVNLFDLDLALREALDREGGGWGADRVREVGAVAGGADAREHARAVLKENSKLLGDLHGQFRLRLPNWNTVRNSAFTMAPGN